MVRVNLAVGPAGWIKVSTLKRNENGLLFGLKDLDRHPARGSMNTPSCGVPAPDQSAPRRVVQIDEGLPLEEALPHETYGVFDHRLVFRMPRPGRVRKKAPVVGVLQKRPVEPW